MKEGAVVMAHGAAAGSEYDSTLGAVAIDGHHSQEAEVFPLTLHADTQGAAGVSF